VTAAPCGPECPNCKPANGAVIELRVAHVELMQMYGALADLHGMTDQHQEEREDLTLEMFGRLRAAERTVADAMRMLGADDATA
jgi:hypothetical protein